MVANTRTFRCETCPAELDWGIDRCPSCGTYIAPVFTNNPAILSPRLTAGQRGAVIADETYEQDFGVVGKSTFNPEYLRKVCLLFDVLDWPTFDMTGSGSELETGVDSLDAEQSFLRQEGVLYRSRIELTFSTGYHRLLEETVWEPFWFLNERDKGQWSVVLDGRSDPTLPDRVDPQAGWALQFQNAIVLPTGDVPLESVLSFKERHRSELIALRRHIESLSHEASLGGLNSQRGHQLLRDLEADLEEYTRKVVHGTNWSLGSFVFDVACNIATVATTQIGNHELKVGAIEALGVTPTLKLVKGLLSSSIKTDARSAPLAIVLRAWRGDLR